MANPNGAIEMALDVLNWSYVIWAPELERLERLVIGTKTELDDCSTGAGAKRVLMVVDSFDFGGAECLLAELGRCAPDGWDLSVASLAPADQGRNAMHERFVGSDLRPSYLSVRKLMDPRGFVKLVRTLRDAPVDVVHAHLDYSAILVPIAARLAGKPVVATLHVNPQSHRRRRERVKEFLAVRVPARLGRLVLVSGHAYTTYSDQYGPAKKTWRIIPNGIDLHRYSPARRRVSTGAPVWAVIAALRPGKRHCDAVRAWAGVVAAQPDAKLLVVGDGPARTEIEQAVKAAGLGDSVRFLGCRNDVHAILRSVDGVISASADEALPTALIEAAACGLPVVATDAGGTREIVIDRVNGRLVPVGAVTQLTDAVLDIIDNPSLAAKYGAAGRSIVEQHYSFSTWTDHLGTLYDEVIGGVDSAHA